jgi:uncharacterized Zn-finger protein
MRQTYTLKESDLPAQCPPDGIPQWNSHPKIYLALDEKNNEAQCPYCGNLFTLENIEQPLDK